MEIVERKQDGKNVLSNEKNALMKVKNRSKKYVQPMRAESFAPKQQYFPSKNPLERITTYHSSYYNYDAEACEVRQKPFKPVQHINSNLGDKFADDTTVKLSFKPIWGVYKAQPVLPRDRLNFSYGPMECTTTIQRDYSKKVVSRPELIIPRGNIKSCKTTFDGTTTMLLSYAKPRTIEPVISFKPQFKYCSPIEPTANETTQKLSYLPYKVGIKENYPWSQKLLYRPPKLPMPGETTYAKSYLKNESRKESPILPIDAGVLPNSREFDEKTIYRVSFLACPNESATSPILPSPNLSLSDSRMLCDTTNKLSFRPVAGEKRRPIVPRPQRRLLACGPTVQSTSTNRAEFTPKNGKRPELALPCAQIRVPSQPLDAATTANLSYANPGPANPQPNCKPISKYCTPEEKVQSITVSKLSYPQWPVGGKEALPWAKKARYQRPSEKMPADTVYHSSFSPPGYYVDDVNN